MSINAVVRTTQYLGDHGREVAVAVEPKPGETVEDFAARVLSDPNDHIELRLVVTP